MSPVVFVQSNTLLFEAIRPVHMVNNRRSDYDGHCLNESEQDHQ